MNMDMIKPPIHIQNLAESVQARTRFLRTRTCTKSHACIMIVGHPKEQAQAQVHKGAVNWRICTSWKQNASLRIPS